MPNIHYSVFYLGFMVILLGCSAFFSGSETALFSLSRNAIKTMNQSRHRLEKLAVSLLRRPKQLLGSLLLGNLIVNVLFFSTTSVLCVKLEHQTGASVAAAVAFAAFIMLILCGEILPKYLSYNNSRRICILSALPVYLVVRFFSPVVTFFRKVFVEPFLRLFLGPLREPELIAPDEFKTLIETTRQRGLISDHQDKIMTELLDFGFLKVKNVLRPRVDIVACNIEDTPQKAMKIMTENRLTRIPVYAGSIDDIIGTVQLRDILLSPDRPLRQIAKDVEFVPEQKSIESILEYFKERKSDIAIVVDEYGGVAGLVSLEDIAEELFGSIGAKEEIDMIERIAPNRYRLSGFIPIHDWTKKFGLKRKNIQIATVGGFVAALLGRIPRQGDVINWENLTFTVEKVSKHRITSLLFTINPEKEDD